MRPPTKRPLRKAGMPTWYFQRKRKHVFKQGHFFRGPLFQYFYRFVISKFIQKLKCNSYE